MPSVPSLQKRLAKFRGPTSSGDYNQNQEELFFDNIQLHALLNDLEKDLEQAKEILTIENKFLQIKIEDLQQQIFQLEQQLLQQQEQKIMRAYLSDFSTDPLDKNNAFLDLEHGFATLPLDGHQTSKLTLYDEIHQTVVVPDALKVQVTPAADSRTIFDNDIMRAVDGNTQSYWHRKVILPVGSTTNSVEATMTIKLPDTIISSRDCNTICIHPYPANSVDIMAVEYRIDGNWHLIPGWEGPILGASSTKFCFYSLQIAEVRVTLRQRHWIEDKYQKAFHLGLQEIGVYYSDYQSNSASFYVEYELPGEGASKTISAIQPCFANGLVLTDTSRDKRTIAAFDVYTRDPSGQLVYTEDTLPITISDNLVVLKVTLHKDPHNAATPALRYIDLTYEVNP